MLNSSATYTHSLKIGNGTPTARQDGGHTMSRDKEKNKPSISLAITGSGGAGVMTAGNLLLEVAAQAGWYGLMVRSSGPQIRGGEAAALLRFSHAPIECLDDRFDVLIGIDWQNIHRFADEIPLDAASVMIGDPDQSEPPEVFVKRGARYAPLPFKQMAKAIPGSWPNMIALGLAAGLCGLPAQSMQAVLQKSLKKGGGEKMAANLAAAEAGYAAAAKVPAVPRLAGHVAPGASEKSAPGATCPARRGTAGTFAAAAYPASAAARLAAIFSPPPFFSDFCSTACIDCAGRPHRPAARPRAIMLGQLPGIALAICLNGNGA